MEWLCVGGLVLGVLFWIGSHFALRDAQATTRDMAMRALELERENERLRVRLDEHKREMRHAADAAYRAGALHERMRAQGQIDDDAVTMLDDGEEKPPPRRRSKR